MPGTVRVDALLGGRGRDALDAYEAAQQASRLKGARSGSETNISSKNRQEANTLHALNSPVNSRPLMQAN